MTVVAPANPAVLRPLAPPRVSLLTTAEATGTLVEERTVRPLFVDPDLPCNTEEFSGLWWSCPEGAGQSAVDVYDNDEKPTAAMPDSPRFVPFDAFVGLRCRGGIDNFMEEKARRLLTNNQSRIIEAELWTGARAQQAGFPNDYLLDTPTDVHAAGSVGFVTALAELEQAVGARQDEPGWVHAQRRVVTAWLQNGLIAPSPSGRTLMTPQGTIVVPGDGYPGTGFGVGTATAAESVAFATGAVEIHLGQMDVLPDFTVTGNTNSQVARAERQTLYAFRDCVKVGIRVDLTQAFG